MSTTVGTRREVTLPLEIFEAAELKPGDAVDWRYEDGEIRGRRVAEPPALQLQLKTIGQALVVDTEGVSISLDGIQRAVRDERNQA